MFHTIAKTMAGLLASTAIATAQPAWPKKTAPSI